MRMRGGYFAVPTSKTTQGEYKNVILWNLSSAVCFSYITEPVTKFINFCIYTPDEDMFYLKMRMD